MRDYYAEMQKAYQEATQMSDGASGKVSFSVCPTTDNKPCRLCDLCKSILFNQRNHTAQQIQMARDLNRKDRFYSNIVLISKPSEVLVMEVGTTIGNKLLSYEMGAESEMKSFWHPDHGRNLYVVKYPNPDKRKNRYDVEPRIAQSPLIDRSVLDRLYDLDTVIELIKANQIMPLYQSKFPDGRTEIRVLPSWLGPKYASVFQLRYRIHYGTSEEELEAIQRGELNPLSDILGKSAEEPKPIIVPSPKPTPQPAGTSSWSKAIESPLTTPSPISPSPSKPAAQLRCFGTYDADEEECASVCEDRESCKAETESKLAQRKSARGLYR